MPKGYRKKRGEMQPSRELRTHIMFHLQPEDVLDEDIYIEKMLLVRYRIICVFAHSIDPETKRGVFGNYLVGIGPRLAQLNRFVSGKISSRGVLSREDLPEPYRSLDYKWRKMVINKVMRRLIERQLNHMRQTGDLYPLDQQGGIWEICQSVADEQLIIQTAFASIYGKNAKPYRESKPRYRDERNHHGRPSGQSRRRDRSLRQAPGISIGTSSF